jgi:tRNA A-37 threonylcarbamoyl transferase component Bud32
MSGESQKVKVSDPFGAASDEAMPTLALALDPAAAQREFKRGLPRLAGKDGQVRLKSIRVLRHKPGKRCVIAYDVRVQPPEGPRLKAMIVGKVRSRRFGNEPFRLLETIWKAGFKECCADGVAVPEPIGVIPGLNMWVQRWVRGTPSGALLAAPDGVALARRIAEAIHKLHRASVPTQRTHSMADELRILHECVPQVGKLRPELGARLGRLLRECERLGARVTALKPCGIHRDFYPAQVLVDGARLWLIDFDLYCQGDPGLDVGNFIGHLTEESLRTFGDATAWRDREQAMEERFVELSGEAVRASVRVYTTLTLVRHIYLSTQFAERMECTERLLELCEQRLADS